MFIVSQIEHAPLARALTRAAYAAGARYVDVNYRDQHVRKAMIELGPDEALTYTPDWMKERAESLDGAAMIATTGDPEPELLGDLDGERVGKAQMKEVTEIIRRHMVARRINWSGVAYPNAGWANEMFGEPDVERLWEAVAFCTRLDEPDPVAAWRDHMARLERRAATSTTSVRRTALPGPGTDFTVGLPRRRVLSFAAAKDYASRRVSQRLCHSMTDHSTSPRPWTWSIHLDHDIAGLKEMFRVTKTGGYSVIFVPAFNAALGRTGRCIKPSDQIHKIADCRASQTSRLHG